MALADIIKKIESDAAAEAKALTDAADERAARITAAAQAQADEYRASTVSGAEFDAQRESARVLAAAKLAARDGALRKRHELLGEVLAQTADAIAKLPDSGYASFLARRLIAVARGGEKVRLGSADAGRIEALAEAVRMLAPGLQLDFSSEPAPFERGALVEGDRVRADLSLPAIIEEQRDDLELTVASILFSEGA